MILEYAAMAGGILIAGGALALIAVLTLAGRSNDEGVFDAAELVCEPPGPAAATLPPQAAPGGHLPCPNSQCRGRHCSTWRRRGVPCSDQTATIDMPLYTSGLPLPRDGRHAVSTVLVRWLAGDWWEVPMPVRLRRQLGRMAGAARVPVQLSYPVRRLP